MRISNITQYLGGADNVVATEIVEGDQYLRTITTDGAGIPFDAALFDLDYALFKANITARGSSVVINSFERVNTDGSTGSSGTPIETKTLNQSFMIDNPRADAFEMLVPSFLLSQFSAGSTNFGGTTLQAGSNHNELIVIDSTLSGTLNQTGTLALTWQETDNGALVTRNLTVNYNSYTVDVNDPTRYTFTLSQGYTWNIDADVQHSFNELEDNLKPEPDTTDPYVVVQSLRWDNAGAIRTIRFLWVIRYSPKV